MFVLKNTKWFIVGFACCLLLTGVAGLIFADAVERSITVSYDDIKVYVDGNWIQPADANGDTVEPFIYNGTTFLPVRAIGEALGKTVRWDNAAKSAYIGLLPETAVPPPEALADKNKARIEMADGGSILLELYPDIAPITVANFKTLISRGFYDGLTFHRVINGFMIQGGDPEGTGYGGSATQIKGEFQANGVENNLSHTRGVLSMARNSISMDSASSQFFIMHQDEPYLDGQYAAFGRVIEGMDVVDAIAVNTPVEDMNGTVAAANQPKIKSITLE